MLNPSFTPFVRQVSRDDVRRLGLMMDRFGQFPDDQGPGFASLDAAVPHEADPTPPPMIGQDERRMHVRAYNFWANLLGSRSFPSIDHLDLNDIGDFGAHAVLLDFTSGIENPAIGYVGDALVAECELTPDVGYIADVPRGSLLSRLTDHYLQIIANRAPIGFEAEFVNARGVTIMYRGVLLPFSSDDDTIDFILGVINWKQAAEPTLNDALAREVSAAAALHTTAPAHGEAMPLWADGPVSTDIGRDDDGAFVDMDSDEATLPELVLSDSEASLADRLAIARETASVAAQTEGRSRKALYEAICHAWSFAVGASEAPQDYAEMVQNAGLVMSPRSPMTTVAKLVFGTGYDKTRLAEIATVLRYAEREAVDAAELLQVLDTHAGGIKGLVQAERRRARPVTEKPDRALINRQKLRHAAPLAQIVGLPHGDDEFVVLVARRDGGGITSVVATLSSSDAEQVITRLG
jgi:hypothetical protein